MLSYRSLLLGTVGLGVAVGYPAWAEPIPPQGLIQYQSEDRGQPGHTNFGVRIPLTRQSASYLFLEPALKLFDNGQLGSTVVLGWRTLNPTRKDIIGLFVAYDNRDVQGTFFHQLGAGVEYKQERFGAYVNGFFPIGRRQGDAGLGALLDANFFDGPFYVFERRERQVNIPLSGVEVAVDTTIPVGADYLRPKLGVYYLESSVTNTVGVKGEMRYENRLVNLGLGVRHDNIFDTTVSFQVGINLPRQPRTPSAPNINNRLYEPVEKPSTILVQKATDGIANILAINPDTNQPYQFYIVTDNPAGLRGTPVVFPGTSAGLTAALARADNAGGNGVTYVYQKNGALPAFVGNFTVGNGVKLVSSSAPVANFFGKSLPFIALRGVGGPPVDFDNFLVVNDGQPLPQINGNLTLTASNRQAVVGFEINPTGRGIDGTNNSNTIILSNKINNAVDDAIRLQNASGLTQVVNNQINNTKGANDTNAILITANSGNVVVADSKIQNTESTNTKARGIGVEALGNTNTVTVLNSQVDNTKGKTVAVGVGVSTNGGDIGIVTVGGTNTINLTQATAGTVVGDGASGIAVTTNSANNIQSVNVIGSNTITDTKANFNNATALGLTVTTNTTNSSIGQVNISANNSISNTTANAPVNASAGGIGVFTSGNSSTIGVVNITGNNTISNTTSQDQAGAIGVTTNGANSTIGSVNITGNNTIINTATTGFRATGLAIAATGANSEIATGGVINITGANTVTNTSANNFASGAGVITNLNANNSSVAKNGTINIANMTIQNTTANPLTGAATGLGIGASGKDSSVASGGTINISQITVNQVTSGLSSSGIGISTGFPGQPLLTGQTLGDINITGVNNVKNITANIGTASGIGMNIPNEAVNTTTGNIVIGSANPAERSSVQGINGNGLNGRAFGVEVRTAIGTNTGNVTIQNIDVSTQQQVIGKLAARGIYVEAGSTVNNPTAGTMGNVVITNNNVGSSASPVQMTDPSFRDAIGILVRAINNNTIGNTTVSNNKVDGVVATAQGRVQGIIVNSFVPTVSFVGNPLIGTVGGAPSVIIENNIVNVGNNISSTTDGIHLGTEVFNFGGSDNPQVGRAVIRNNTVTVTANTTNLSSQAGATGIRIYNDNLAVPNRNHVNVDILNNTITFNGGVNVVPTALPNDGSSSGVFVQANTGTAARPVCVQIANNTSTTALTNNTHFRFLNVANGVTLLNATPNPIPTNAVLGTFLAGVGNTTTGGGSFAFSNNPTIPAINPIICPNY